MKDLRDLRYFDDTRCKCDVRRGLRRGEAASYYKAPMQQLSQEAPWGLDSDTFKEATAERLAYYRNQHDRYQRYRRALGMGCTGVPRSYETASP